MSISLHQQPTSTHTPSVVGTNDNTITDSTKQQANVSIPHKAVPLDQVQVSVTRQKNLNPRKRRSRKEIEEERDIKKLAKLIREDDRQKKREIMLERKRTNKLIKDGVMHKGDMNMKKLVKLLETEAVEEQQKKNEIEIAQDNTSVQKTEHTQMLGGDGTDDNLERTMVTVTQGATSELESFILRFWKEQCTAARNMCRKQKQQKRDNVVKLQLNTHVQKRPHKNDSTTEFEPSVSIISMFCRLRAKNILPKSFIC
jgi:hypothetical protein